MTQPDKTPLHIVIPGRLDTPTGGFVYDRHMIAGLQAGGRCAGVHLLAGSFPNASAETIAAAATQLAALPTAAWVIVDGLALTPLAPCFRQASGRLRLIALIHHPLCDEPGQRKEDAQRLFRQECRALAAVDGVIVTSQTTRARLADFGLAPERIQVVIPGAIAQRPLPRRRRRRTAPTEILSVGSLIPRKGQDILLEALARRRRSRWHLTLVGPARDRRFARRLRLRARALRLLRRITFSGTLAPHRLRRCYSAADLFVLSSRHEGFGIVLAEALAHGLPIVATRAGAIPEVLPGNLAILVPPDDARALGRALAVLLAHRASRMQAARRTRGAAERPRRWSDAAHEFQIAVDRIISR